MDNQEGRFEYTYSAAEQEEIEKIKSKYVQKGEDKLEQIRALDASVTKPGTIAGITMGVIGMLMFGGGLSATLVSSSLFIPGVILGLAGIVLMAAAYPVYKKITDKQREHIAPQILAMIDELAK